METFFLCSSLPMPFFKNEPLSFIFLRERVCTSDGDDIVVKHGSSSVTRATVQSPLLEATEELKSTKELQSTEELESANRNAVAMQTSSNKPKCSTRSLTKSDSICASMCVGMVGNDREVHVV